jgi:hypothetical protein
MQVKAAPRELAEDVLEEGVGLEQVSVQHGMGLEERMHVVVHQLAARPCDPA